MSNPAEASSETHSPHDHRVTAKTYPELKGSNLESTLCFPKDIFYAGSFDVDSFLAHYKRDYSLERLQSDLGIFLKVLEMSMSDLINKDYPDFVNLSTNLVDLDKAINDLKLPLEAIKLEVDETKHSIDNEMNQIMSKLNEKLMIEKKRIVLKLLMNWQRSLKVTNDMIGSENSDDINSQKLTGDHLERIAFEFCQLKNSLSICSGEGSQNSKQNSEVNKLSEMLLKKMQELFLNSLNLKKDFSSFSDKPNDLNDPETQQQLKHVLKSYALLSMHRQAEQLFTDGVVKPYMTKHIRRDLLDNNIQNLNAIFDKILEFFDQNLQFLQITAEIKNNSRNSSEFDFIINSVWSSIVDCFDLHLGNIYSPADPDIFHQRYLASFEFLNKFELKCAQFNDKDLNVRLQKSQSFKHFVKKWPVQTYFQIRFQEIVSKIEEELFDYKKTLTKPTDENLDADENELNDRNPNAFNLKITESIVNRMEYCWSESSCFLKALLSQFWKLNLQILSRYCNFFIQNYQTKVLQLEKSNQTIDQFSQLQVQDQQETARAETPENAAIETSQTEMSNKAIDDLTLSVFLLLDVHKLWKIKLPNFFDGVIAPIMRSANAIKDITILKDAFSLSLSNLNELQVILIDYIVKKEIEECSDYLKNVNDIARLYRRTNREIPKTASAYVGLTIKVIEEFKEKYGSSRKSTRQQELINKCINNIIDLICIEYESVASDLLESVKKMEDSLKRLHRVRNNKSTASNLSNLQTMSDDDKIRLQLSLDITELGDQLMLKFNGYKGESNYDSLYKLADEINQNLAANKPGNMEKSKEMETI